MSRDYTALLSYCVECNAAHVYRGMKPGMLCHLRFFIENVSTGFHGEASWVHLLGLSWLQSHQEEKERPQHYWPACHCRVARAAWWQCDHMCCHQQLRGYSPPCDFRALQHCPSYNVSVWSTGSTTETWTERWWAGRASHVCGNLGQCELSPWS